MDYIQTLNIAMPLWFILNALININNTLKKKK